MSELTARFDLPLGAEAPRAARHAVAPVLHGWGYADEDWLHLARLVVSELVANAVLHGGGCLSLELQAHDGGVVVSVADGSAVLPTQPDPTSLDPARLAAGGRGVALIEAFGCAWGTHDHEGGKRVWVRLPEHPLTPGPGTAGVAAG
ncbi:ATP-binding protein [Spirilliplanes yamanashiensis]|uniref:Histidine kinase/HSP90-like ATPase domain-containing protein n=1 Tax=Spirilliplanes yamanashiensis TaxID=42233 RepID=A0A8J3YBU5_9ACTN|nr:ATP-binding protein [Spirilliplanes yamanashiensis]MDP9816163.1 anti-sigma regulatory factor (Ser/Thr protein kinase) [Spirilliplanes yamanashiensis]GIJ05688.1 hypothetical protein Sya03_50400 [Spirilliplanes yamanashiensis]